MPPRRRPKFDTGRASGFRAGAVSLPHRRTVGQPALLADLRGGGGNPAAAVHGFGYGGAPITSTGWPSYYIEEMTGHAQSCQAGLSSMILEGIFERFPRLRAIMVEAGFAWAPSLGGRLDKAW